MKKLLLFVVMVSLTFSLYAAGEGEQAGGSKEFPSRPVRIVNYVAPGGLMDLTTRKFVDIAKKYTDATFVIENQVGAGGIIGMDYVLQRPADGYTIFAATSNNPITVISGGHDQDKYLWGFEWFANLMVDAEAVITNKNLPINDFVDVVKDGKAKNGMQIWVGPSAGGNDHIVGMRIWEALGMEAVWVPFTSGHLAMNALLGGQGVAYVGNAADTVGRPDLKVAAVSSPVRLKAFPDAPTFGELGYPELDNMIMWRGFAIKDGVPREAVQWWQNLVQQVTDDPDWIGYHENIGIQVVNWGTEKYEAHMRQENEATTSFLKKVGIIN